MCHGRISVNHNHSLCQSCKSQEDTMPKVDYYRSISGNGNTSESDGIIQDSIYTHETLSSHRMDIGSAVKSSLLSAQSQGRLTSGIYEAAQLLEMNPDGVMLCILTEDSAMDVGLHIHFTLIEAFCLENDIRVIKVDSSKKLCQILTLATSSRDVNDNDAVGGRLLSADDCSCLLIEYPCGDYSEEEEDILMHHKKTCSQVPQPIIPLPV